MDTTTNDDIGRLARRRAKAKLGWFSHAAVYLVVNLMLVAFSVASGRSWAIYPALGWGLGLLLHGISVWAFAPGGGMLERMVERERAALARARGDRT
ncbi:2TM domain-containing protein [Variovorax sp. PBL-E5]|uniref:2TM domain-containing protein n=1 Tax=Variovorax sp. PBL-E5 TaxID=434014 RepID=UPI0013186EF0|nr:2TM domain-containing protein [Variovorax sp. PBL-E5]VTU32168.1 hypothetical protein E5CHR_03362 [Variovorax sp. PBL-E5]